MKKIAVIFFSLAALLFVATGQTQAQEKAITEITTVKQKGETILVTLTSSKPFIFANNRYALYIGEREFTKYDQKKENDKGILTFVIPADEYNIFRDGDNIYLSYGTINVAETDMEAYAKQSRRCWSLGKFSSSMLTK